MPEPFNQVTPQRQAPRLPLTQDVEVLVQHEFGIAPELASAVAKQNTAAASRGPRTKMQACVQGLLDDADRIDGIAEHDSQRGIDMGRRLCRRGDEHGDRISLSFSGKNLTMRQVGTPLREADEFGSRLLSDAEAGKNPTEQIVRRELPGDLCKALLRAA